MKVTELIVRLKAVLDQEGNVRVLINDMTDFEPEQMDVMKVQGKKCLYLGMF